MTAPVFTREEAHVHLESAVERRKAASRHYDSMARTIAETAVRTPYWVSSVEHLLLIERAAEFEALADWHDAREMCGFEAVR